MAEQAKTMGGEAAFPFSFTVVPGSNDPFTGKVMGDKNERRYVFPGLSRREYFAGLAMQGRLSQPDDRTYGNRDVDDEGLTVEQWRAKLYAMDAACDIRSADALLSAFAKEENQ